MKVCIVSRSDGQGGAFIAAHRLHKSLIQEEIDSIMWVGDKTTDDYRIKTFINKLDKIWYKVSATLDAIPLALYPEREPQIFSNQWFPDRTISHLKNISCDIINLHWINGGYLQLENIAKLQKPLVWTLHDMWAFTGGCHYSGITAQCDRYTKFCGKCPTLVSNRECDLSHFNWQRKARLFSKLDLTLVTPSNWLADCVKSSSLLGNFRVEVIANPVDINIYRPIEKPLARDLLQLPLHKQIITFGALKGTDDPRKGFQLLLPALKQLNKQSQWRDKIHLVVFGAGPPNPSLDIDFPITYLDRLNDDISLALTYSAADIMIVPSLVENLAQTAIESLACGTPVVAFNFSGLKDAIVHKNSGYLAEPFSIDDLANGISWLLEDPQRYAKISWSAREQAVEKFGYTYQANKYISLFKEIFASKTSV